MKHWLRQLVNREMLIISSEEDTVPVDTSQIWIQKTDNIVYERHMQQKDDWEAITQIISGLSPTSVNGEFYKFYPLMMVLIQIGVKVLLYLGWQMRLSQTIKRQFNYSELWKKIKIHATL
jgi:uncharacterized membrane protein